MTNPLFPPYSQNEWLVTNGIGGYASSTLCGCNTRRYHGLLVASFQPPTHRYVLISKLEEKVIASDREFLLSTNAYPGVIHPQGYEFLKKFERSPFPQMQFGGNGFSLHKTVFMPYGHNITVVAYENRGSTPLKLELTPFIVYRDFHHLQKEEDLHDIHVREEPGALKLNVNGKEKPVHLFFSSGNYVQHRDWYRDLEYEHERERGLDFREDVATIGNITAQLTPGETLYITLSAEDSLPDGGPAQWMSHEVLRLQTLYTADITPFLQDLMISGDQFVVWRKSSSSFSMIAGYHWFTDWGRDTMIAMRGLLIATGKQEIARSMLMTFLKYLDEGMIPNRFPDQDEDPEYNTIDATLWMFVAIYEYYEKFRDEAFVRQVYPSLQNIIDKHYAGTRYHIKVTPEGLLYGGEDHVQLTWMDAKVDGHVVTPRIGCAVEINALWYNALEIISFFSELTGVDSTFFKTKARQTKNSFRQYFINAHGYLNDVVIPDSMTDDAIRPNQVYAVSLPFTPLEHNECVSVLDIIEQHLYTDYGLRSLSPHHPDFKPIYTGDPWQRDHAYHQGTVWMYLWGEYALAYLRVHDYTDAAKKIIREKATRLEHHFYHEDGIQCMSEIFDGGNPEKGKGCIHQAWSVGMTLMALLKAKGNGSAPLTNQQRAKGKWQ